MTERSFATIRKTDLKRLARIAAEDRQTFFRCHERWRPYQDRILLVALSQGAALHYVDRETGVKDFDVWTFYAEEPGLSPFPYRRNVERDFGHPKFGKRPGHRNFVGRPVDLLARSIPVAGNPIKSVQRYLQGRRTRTARELAMKAVVVLEPRSMLGRVIWARGGPR